PGRSSTPDATSTANGRSARTTSPTVSGRSPPATKSRSTGRSAASAASSGTPVPPGRPATNLSTKRESVAYRAASARRRSSGRGRHGLDRPPRPPATVRGRFRAVELERREPDVPCDLHDTPARHVDEHAHERRPRNRARDRTRACERDTARTPLEEVQAEKV